jgi:hypothetical protein
MRFYAEEKEEPEPKVLQNCKKKLKTKTEAQCTSDSD